MCILVLFLWMKIKCGNDIVLVKIPFFFRFFFSLCSSSVPCYSNCNVILKFILCSSEWRKCPSSKITRWEKKTGKLMNEWTFKFDDTFHKKRIYSENICIDFMKFKTMWRLLLLLFIKDKHKNAYIIDKKSIRQSGKVFTVNSNLSIFVSYLHIWIDI